MKKRLRGPSPALVISLVALFVALGGTTYAATSLPRNSVGTKQLKNGAVTKSKVSKKTIAALKGLRGPRGASGPQGLQGAAGPQGSQGPIGPSNAYYATAATGEPSVLVPAGDYAVSGTYSVGLTNTSGVSCVIQVNGVNAGPFASADSDTNPLEVNVPDSAILHLSSPGTVSNQCGFDFGAGTQISRTVTAIKVDSASP